MALKVCYWARDFSEILANPKVLFDTLIFYIGLYFALRSSLEHHNLWHESSYLDLVEKPGSMPYLKYQEDTSITDQGP